MPRFVFFYQKHQNMEKYGKSIEIYFFEIVQNVNGQILRKFENNPALLSLTIMYHRVKIWEVL